MSDVDRLEGEMAAVCVCGHARRYHMGPVGTCIRGVVSGEASVCPCPRYRKAAA